MKTSNTERTGNTDSKVKVFVYGTLKQGYGNHCLLEDSTFLGKCTTEPEFTLHSLYAFPAVLPFGNTAIKGEVYEVDDKTFKRLDRLEGYPSLYERIQIPTEYGDAWIYVMDSVSNLKPIESGEWE